MDLVDEVTKGNLKNVKKILNERRVSASVLKKALNVTTKRRNKDNVLNVLDTNKKDKSDYAKIHNLLVAHSTVKHARKNKENIDTHVVSNIAGYLGGKRRTAKRARKSRRRTRRTLRHTLRRRNGTRRR